MKNQSQLLHGLGVVCIHDLAVLSHGDVMILLREFGCDGCVGDTVVALAVVSAIKRNVKLARRDRKCLCGENGENVGLTYKIVSIWARVRPLVSGSMKKAQSLANSIHEAKKNQVP